jgi:hypothetical protein
MASSRKLDGVPGLGFEAAGAQRPFGAEDQQPTRLDDTLDRPAVQVQYLGCGPRAATLDNQIEIPHGTREQAAAAAPVATELEGLEAPLDASGRRFSELQQHAGALDQGDRPIVAGKEREIAGGSYLGDAEAPKEILAGGWLAGNLARHALAVPPGHGPISGGPQPHLVPNRRSPASPRPGTI